METRGQWFVVQALSGQELKARDSIKNRIIQEEMSELVYDIQVPMEKVTDVKQGRRTTVRRKFFPGYILVNALLYDERRKVNEKVWTFISETNGVIGFLGGDKPVALPREEVEAIFQQVDQGEDQPKPRVDFEIGETVRINDGPFENFEGKIESIDPVRGRLKLSVTIFGRSTPVEVEYWQVSKAE